MTAILHQRHKYTSLKRVYLENDTFISSLSDAPIKFFLFFFFKERKKSNYYH